MTQQHQDLDSLNERADRVLNGMSINRELFARDVKRMAAELAKWRNAHARSEPENARSEPENARSEPENARSEPENARSSQFSGAFDDLFGGFGNARK